MQKKDWIAVGAKLLGIYIAVMALIGAGSAVLNTLMTFIFSDRPASVGFFKMLWIIVVKVLLFNLVVPAAQGFVAWLLLKRTDWCLRKAGLGCEPPQM
ncbi:MAG TPA: hypothetical protein PLD51_05635 [Pontiellaceae bacterium]|nr:hypothetical protein [Pontiellaceae bacterium]HPR83323.1 hypothetical protein [Pontiellaceae bacterium]